MAKSAIAAIALGLFLNVATAQEPSSTAELWRFAKANEGRFATELKMPARSLTLRLAPNKVKVYNAGYDAARGAMTRTLYRDLSWETVDQVCKSAGSFVGQNAYGAKTTVRRRVCERLEVRDDDGLELGDFEVAMSPDQYRAMKRDGARFEIEFSAGQYSAAEVVVVNEKFEGATITEPVETVMKVWQVRGKIVAARLLAPEGAAVLAAFTRP